MTKKKYEYFYPENKKLGDLIKGTGTFINRKFLGNRYTDSYVNSVFRGERHNDEIVAAMKKMAELLNANNY